MNRFDDKNGRPRSEGRGNFNGPPRSFGARRPQKPQFDIQCSACGANDQVPFEPIEGSEVLCRECHQKQRERQALQAKYGTRPDKRDEDAQRRGKHIPRLDHGTRVIFPITCSKCGANDTLPYRPATSAPLLCMACLEQERGSDWRQLQRQMDKPRASDAPAPRRRMIDDLEIAEPNPLRLEGAEALAPKKGGKVLRKRAAVVPAPEAPAPEEGDEG